MAFFQKTILKKYQAMLPKEHLTEAWNNYRMYFLNPEIQENILHSKEEQFQEGFLRELFVKVLGYTLNPSPNYNLITEQKNEADAKKADGAIWLNGKVVGVIELKDHKTTDLKKVETQAFQYKSQNKDARYVIISNFEKLRLYIDNATEHREWNLFTMTEDDFLELYCSLAWSQIEKGVAIQMKEASVSVEKDVTKALYRDYSLFKNNLFEDILKNNPSQGTDIQEWQLLLYKKTQKLLDRLLFIFFAEDGGLLPPNSMVQILNQWQQLKDLDAYIPLYNRIKQYFGYLDKGNDSRGIFAYNGGLFREDEILDALTISDDLLFKHTSKLAEYDFKSDVDVNILGHIFEHSLSEIEEVTQRIMGVEVDASKSKRKKDGVFYTPPYITKYIVENTVGKLCEEKKQELGIEEKEYFSDRKRQKQTKQNLLEKLTIYRDWLLQITILDPACGSGAFLNAALSFLMDEHHLIDEMEAKITGSSIVFPDIENSILEHNLYGVDINEESVEIAQLALWLRTAKPQRKLNSLNENIKCGNSLISDPAIAGDKAFDWEKEFPQVFAKGGFDVVIGNPPYVRIQQLKQEEIDFYFNTYKTPCGKLDLSIIFFERAIQILNSHGLLSYISTSQWMKTDYGKNIRELFSKGKLRSILDFGSLPVFEDADTYPAIFLISNLVAEIFTYGKVSCKDDLSIERLRECKFKEYNLKDFTSSSWKFSEFDLIQSLNRRNIDYKQLKYLAPSFIGDLTGKDDAFVLTKEESESLKIEKDIIYPYAYRGEEVASYSWVEPKSVVIYPYHQTGELFSEDYFLENYPNAYAYLASMKDVLMQRLDSRKLYATQDKWFRHLRPGQVSHIMCKKILVKGIGVKLQAGLLPVRSIYNGANVPAIVLPNIENYDKLLLSLLNSKLITYYMTDICPKKLGGYYRFNSTNISSIPIVISNNPESFIDLVSQMLDLNRLLQEKRDRFLRRLSDNFEGVKISGTLSTFEHLEFADFLRELKKQKITLKLSQQDEWEEYFNDYRSTCRQLSEQITKTYNEIDLRVYKLYGLTFDEVLIVDADFSVSREEYNKF